MAKSGYCWEEQKNSLKLLIWKICQLIGFLVCWYINPRLLFIVKYITCTYSQNNQNLHIMHETLLFFPTKQKTGLPMGSSHKGDFARLFLEFIEIETFKDLISKDSNYFCYIADILIIHTRNLELTKMMDRFYNTEPTVDLNCEIETNNTSPFFVILLINKNYKLGSELPYTFLLTL